MRICVFGDSITEGYHDGEVEGGWVRRLEMLLGEGAEIQNFGVSGDTTQDLLKRFGQEISGIKPDRIIFAIGINDSIYIPSQSKNYVSFSDFQKNLKKIIGEAKKVCEEIVFVGLVWVDEDRVMPMPWEPKLHYTNKEIEKYDNGIREICRAENLKFIDVNAEMKKIDYKNLLSDGVHPNAQGHKWLAGLIKNKIEQK
jgi:acyl-CoA thioesterase I